MSAQVLKQSRRMAMQRYCTPYQKKRQWQRQVKETERPTIHGNLDDTASTSSSSSSLTVLRITISTLTRAPVQILAAVSRKLTLAPSVDFDALAHVTGGFSGADLQALVYNAHLEVVHAAIDAEKVDGDS
ncbi:hypothetical protein DFH29DRAFT_1006489 [Suillus ampliporus]|nr:hypothetical protein DFH29DRAFT_1006489 [Suillus ampliporus]